MSKQVTIRIAVFVCVFAGILSGCTSNHSAPESTSQGVAIRLEEMAALQEESARIIASAPSGVMNQSGIAGAMGGSHVKLMKDGTYEILLPIPQLADGQVPLCYYISATPADAAVGFRIWKRDEANVVAIVQLTGKRDQEVQIDWSSFVLVTGNPVSPNNTQPDQYVLSTACVQSESGEITMQAADLWPASGEAGDYAVNIRQFIREMKPVAQPRSLDARGILESGVNTICTANANLALAFFRSKGIASQSMAVIPAISQRLEMHRVVEYFDEGNWISFDPSSLQTDIPMKPWQNIIMATTTISDENLSMKPRMAAMLGCPYGQELEMLSNGIMLYGQDFFWTIAKLVAQFEPDAEGIDLAVDAWNRYIEEGTLSQGQIDAAKAKSATEFLELLQAE